jgi:putative DNA primase/helicase
MQANELDRARDALHSIPPDVSRPDWVRAGMGAHAAGLSFDDFDNWSAGADNYKAPEARATWRSFKAGKVGAASLFGMAKDHGWSDGERTTQRPKQAAKKPEAPPRKPSKGNAPGEVWARAQPATTAHSYILAKRAAGVPMDNLRVLSNNDPLCIGGESMAGALMVPAFAPDGSLQSAQLIPPQGKKMNLPGSPMAGASFTVGETKAGVPVYICEGIGAAWSVWQATGRAAVVAFGWGNVGTVAATLRQQHKAARLVLVPDSGKEKQAHAIALEHGCWVAEMPPDEVDNFDANDLMARDGYDVLATLLERAREPAKPEPRYKLLGAADLRELPPLPWRVRGVLPAVGLAAFFGPSASGKSFLAIDMSAAIAEGQSWFGCRVEAAPVVYAALEGEAGFKLRAEAWEKSRGRALPDGLRLMLQPFKLTDPRDVADFAAVVPAGGVVLLDTLNRAAPTADENSSRDMGEILEAAKVLQTKTGGLVVLVHHTGKNAAAGLRGHSSLFAAMDACIEVTRDGDRREWRVAKSKDGADGEAHSFKLHIEPLGFDGYGDPITSCTVRADTSAQAVQRVKLPQGGNQKLVYDAIRGLFNTGATGKPGAPPLRPCIELETAILAGAARLTCASDRRASRARDGITGLVARGVLGLNEGWLWAI